MRYYKQKKKLFASFLLSLCCIVGFAQNTAPQYFHDTKGNIEVTNSGQLQFTVPIDIPPGIGNVSPKINIIYSTGAGNGLVGYGGNIGGITSISRVGKTIDKDTISKGVQLDYTDYYSFNGQRLILKSGEYGRDGAEYVTEKYSNIKIKSVGSITGTFQAWQGPEYWEVTFEDGSQAWYGATKPGYSSARTPIDYNIVKLKDIHGNYISYTYNLFGNTTSVDNIQWGGNETLNKEHFNKMQFTYATRPTPETAYIRGQLLSQSNILESVTVSSNGKQFKKYVVSYKQDLQKTSYKYIDNIQVFNSKNEPANPIVFNYEKSMVLPVNPNVNTWEIRDIIKLDSDYDLTGDFDGDGKLDIIRYFSNTSNEIPQPGLYLFKNIFDNNSEKNYLGNVLSKAEIKTAIAINLKKNSIIYNKQSFVTYKKISNTSTTKKDLELSFYTVAEDNVLILEYKKVIPNIDSYSVYDDDVTMPSNTTTANILGIENFDFNGDGLSELIVRLNYKVCTPDFSTDPGTDPNGVSSNQPSTGPNQCQFVKKFLAIDLNDALQNNGWYYTLDFSDDQYDRYKSGDFNGDGLSDFLKVDSNNMPYLITFKKSSEGKYYPELNIFPTQSIYNNTGSIAGLWNQGVVGDFNGDGLNDVFVPRADDSDLWLIYLSSGVGLKEEIRDFSRPQNVRTITQGSDDSFIIKEPVQFIAYDINNDGKTELVLLASGRYYQKSLQQDSNQSVKYVRKFSRGIGVLSYTGGDQSKNPPNCCTGPGAEIYLNNNNISAEMQPSWPDMTGISLNYQSASMMKKFVFATIHSNPGQPGLQNTRSHPYYDIAKEGRVVAITQAGITTNITYKELDKNINPGLYSNTKSETYPYVEFTRASKVFVVSQLSQSLGSDKTLLQDFKYRGLVSHILGKGMIGFRQTARSSWYAPGFENTIIWSGSETDPLNDGIPVKEWSIRTNDESKVFPTDISENNTSLLSFKSTTYQIDKFIDGQIVTTSVPNASKYKVVTAVVPKSTRGKDFLTGSIAQNLIIYGQYYLPVQSISTINNSASVTTSTFEYASNPSGTGANYYIGRLLSKNETVEAYGDSQSSQQEYIYDGNLLRTIKKWNRDISAYIAETYKYDGFGNIIQKQITNTLDSQKEVAISEYDDLGRFVIKKTNNLGLETQITYNDRGQILKQTDPLGNTIANTYDDWGKLSSTQSSLEGTTSYIYERDSNSNVFIQQIDPDGGVSQRSTNKLGQEYKISTKAFGQGQFVLQETQFDILGRKIKESEPYFEGQSALQWNTITYDDSVFPAKVTTTAFNGKQTETIISGFTKTVKEVNGYGRVTTQITDALGNTISTTDKGGTIQFSYNAAGDQIQAKYAENTVTTKYDAWGRKSEFNDPSNGIYKYEYDGLGRPKKTTSPKGTKEYAYNNLGQLVSQTELSSADGGQATNKSISFSYNNKGLLTGKSGMANSQPFSTTYTYDPNGRIISTIENSNGRIYSEKGIVYDAYGRMASYDKELQSSGITTKVTIENIYSSWNGGLSQIKDKNSGKILWEVKEANAKGMILKAKLGAAETNNSYDSNGFLTNVHHTSAVQADILKVKYTFDAIRNELTYRKTEGDFEIEEKFYYDDNNRLVNWTNPVTGVTPSSNRNVYDVKGRILENDQVGTMKYENASKIYRPTGMDLNALGTQNYDGDLIQSIQYNKNNDPVAINGQKSRLGFYYGLTGMRQQVDFSVISTSGPIFGKVPPMPSAWRVIKSKFYDEEGSFEVVRDQDTNQEKHILYIAGNPYESNIIFVKDFAENTGSYKFLHKDYIGSILAITDEAGNKLEQRHYDAWGNFTHLKIGSNPVITDKASIAAASLLIDRGYTSHEHFMGVGIIHMNGRLYDPLLRRFLNADENIQDPMNTQNYNKYGYVMNNPLMYNDPNGEFWWWAAGAIIGGYLSGVQANNGQWNPGKWAWERTWSAVLGGAIGGAAISGALGNIAANAGAIKTVLPGIISGGLNSAFTGSNFLSGMVGGISYSGSVFQNKITSTNIISGNLISSNFDNSSDKEEISIDEIRGKYPRYYKVLTMLHNFVANNDDVSKAFMDNTGMNKVEVLNLLKMESLQKLPLKIDEIVSVFHSGNGKDYNDKWNVGGKTSAYSPHTIIINKLRVMTLERLTVKTAINAYSYALGITTLHELVHYVRFKNNLDNYQYEYGNAFEKQATGIFWPYDENLFKTNLHGWKF